MTQKEFIEKLRKNQFESVEFLSEDAKIFGINVIALYNDFILVAETENFNSGYFLSELVITLCNNYLDINLYDTIYNIFLSITESMVNFKKFKLS